LLAVARPDDTIDVVRGTEHLATLTSHRSRILALALSPCGKRLAVADFDGVVCIHAIP
jgi:WD40 repeat protein